MAEPKWTRGPWTVEHAEPADGGFAISGGNGLVICSRAPWPHRAEESVANAHLMAAAPELYEALDDARIFIDLLCHRAAREGDADQAAEAQDALNMAKAALAKARGES